MNQPSGGAVDKNVTTEGGKSIPRLNLRPFWRALSKLASQMDTCMQATSLNLSVTLEIYCFSNGSVNCIVWPDWTSMVRCVLANPPSAR